MTDSLFQVAHDGKYGKTLYSENPRQAAIKQAAWSYMCGVYSATTRANPDGSYTVTGRGLEDITYEKEI